LATEAGIHPDRFWRIENGYATPTDVERAALADALGVTVADIWPDLAAGAVDADTKPQSAA